ncbi:MAG: cob(I)yrinic acid a,c-diamide adenosyltransferase [Acidobacteriota bacterium]|nr:cob(I)yrinic acid a,c-diamide adenosyltransferase [Acidobacteriota bacterium]
MSSDEKTFNDPKLAINKVYTKTGDKGKTSLVGGQRVAKNSARIETYGTVDELGAFVGSLAVSVARDLPDGDDKTWFAGVLLRIQHQLFNLGSILATLPQDIHPKQPRILPADIERLEKDIDRCNEALPPLRSFVLAGGSRANTDLHICRTVCRRLERLLVALTTDEEVDKDAVSYINRLSDAFFVWSRWVNVLLDQPEVLWQPNLGTGDS